MACLFVCFFSGIKSVARDSPSLFSFLSLLIIARPALWAYCFRFHLRLEIGADVFSPYLGEAEAAVRQAFVLARNAAPALLFFDEIDAIVCKREGGGGKASDDSYISSRLKVTTIWLC